MFCWLVCAKGKLHLQGKFEKDEKLIKILIIDGKTKLRNKNGVVQLVFRVVETP